MFLFDAHLDLAMNALEWNRDLTRPLSEIRAREWGQTDKPDRGRGTVCLPELRRGRIGLVVATQIARYAKPAHPMDGWRSPAQAWAQTQGQLVWYRAMEEAGEMMHIKDAIGLEKHLERWNVRPAPSPSAGEGNLSSKAPGVESLNREGGARGATRPALGQGNGYNEDAPPIGYILSLEGADSIVTLAHLERSYAQGLRAVGPAHYGPGTYAFGTDSEGSIGRRGRELLAEMDRLGLILDATHLCDTSFREALDCFSGPIWASHSNCRALVPHNRQFTDEQIRELLQRGAVIGAPLDAWMMIPGWIRGLTTPEARQLRLATMADHIDHICQLAGNARHCGLGTDLDGGFGREQCPMDLDSIADLQRVPELLKLRGFKPQEVEGVMHGNFIRFLREAWKGRAD